MVVKLCFCGRAAKGFYYQKPRGKKQSQNPRVWCCSMKCLDVVCIGEGKVEGITEAEIAAIEESSGPAGAYLDALGITDLAQMGRNQWLGFLECVVTSYSDALQRIAGDRVSHPCPCGSGNHISVCGCDIPF